MKLNLKNFLSILFLIALPFSLKADFNFDFHQDSTLVTAFEISQEDTTQIKALLQLAEQQWNDSSTFEYQQRALKIATDNQLNLFIAHINSKKGEILNKRDEKHASIDAYNLASQLYKTYKEKQLEAKTYESIAKIYQNQSNFHEAANYFQLAEEVYRSNPEWALDLGRTLNYLGVIYKNMTLEAKGLAYLFESLQIFETHRDSAQMSNALNNIGTIYKNQDNLDLALQYHQRALDLRLLGDNNNAIADSYNNIGIVHRKKGDTKRALEYYQKSLEIREKTGNKRGRASTLNNIGTLYMDLNVLDSAQIFIEKAMRIRDVQNDLYGLCTGFINMGEIYLKQEKYTESEINYNQALEIAKAIPVGEFEALAYEALAKIYAQKGDFSKAYEFQVKHDVLEDSLYNSESQRRIAELHAAYEVESQKNKIELLEQQQNLQKLQIANSDLIRNFLILLILAILIIAAMIFFRYRNTVSLNNELVKAYSELRDVKISKEEKETLLKEVHHRVKNNMQIITSLIRLQASTIKDPEILELFDESQNRIKSMALVHEELYRAQDLASVNVKEYLQKLVSDLLNAYSLDKKVKLNMTVSVFKLSVDTLIPLGLIINEIVSNALKYAFQDSVGTLTLNIDEAENDTIQLTISDDGIGFPEHFSFEKSTSLGLDLIKTLAEQLDGNVVFKNENGAHYTITFPCKENS
jgi:two-component sensor histidine kinase/Tfp pilus assembly protein PilF